MKKVFDFFSNLLIRFYMEIVAGVWGVIVMMPLDSYLYNKYTGSPTYTIDRNFWIFFTSYTIFFIVSGALVPVVRRRQILTILDNLISTKQITFSQKKHILSIVKDTQCCLSIFSKNGFLQFFMKNIFSLGVMFAYFAIEGLIVNTMNDVTLAVPLIFLGLFIALLSIEAIIDAYVAHGMRSNNRNEYNDLEQYGASQELMTYLIDGVRGSNLSEKVSQVVYEDTVEDIAQIMTVSKEQARAKKVVKKTGKALPKGRLEKAKHGIFSGKMKKEKKITKKIKDSKRRKKNKNRKKQKNKNRRNRK